MDEGEVRNKGLKTYRSGSRGSIMFISLIVLCIISGPAFLYFYKDFVYATGGAFPYTKHGGGTTDGEAPYNVGNGPGVDRAINPDYPAYYNDQAGEAGKYDAGECTHCHEPHASFGGSEPLPDITSSAGDAGPDKYLLMKEYGTSANYAELCWYCHENMSNINGSLYSSGYGRWGFYQGKNVYINSSHYNPPAGSFYWPDITGASIWPRKDRSGLPPGNRGSCLNCHTPHGIRGKSGAAYDTGTVPEAMQTVAGGNPSVNEDYLIPRQLIAWEEALCENCHDASGPSTKNIQNEINKRTTGSGHPVDDTTYAGRHVVSEALPITTKHVECYDCHNPHADKSSNRLEGMKYIEIDGTLRDPANGDRQPYVYEVCIKCHGANHNTFIPDKTATGTGAEVGGTLRTTVAQYGCATINPASQCTDGSDKRKEFDTSTNSYAGSGSNYLTGNRAYHPVAAAGRNTSAALNYQLSSLTPGFDTSNTIQCTDCHNNNETGVGTFSGTTATPTYPGPVTQSNTTRATDVASQYSGTEPVGPHGSTNVRILRADYNTTLGDTSSAPFNSFNAGNFALCFNCHNVQAFTDWDGIVGGQQMTNFRLIYCAGDKKNLHAVHLANETNCCAGWDFLNMYTVCANCHYNVHSNAEATNTEYGDGVGGSMPPDGDTHLINFSPIVEPLDFAKPRWFYEGGLVMRCNLKCHGIEMGEACYGPCSGTADAQYGYYGS